MLKQASLILLSSTIFFASCNRDPVDPPAPSTTSDVGTGNGTGTSTSNLTITSFTPTNLIRLCPEWIGGNRDFSGHGPEVRSTISLEVTGASVLRAHIRYHLKETQSDWTEALYDEYIILYSAPNGKVIDRILTEDYLDYEYLDTSHGGLIVNFGAQGLAYKLISMGDTDGNDVGNCTTDDAYLSVYWNPITVQLRSI